MSQEETLIPLTLDGPPARPKDNTATGLGVASAFAPRYLVCAEDVPSLQKSPTGKRILAAAAVVSNSSVTPYAENATHGSTGLSVQQGRIAQEYNSDLTDLMTRMKTFKEMRYSDTAVGSAEMMLSLPLAQTEFYVEPGDDKELADNLEWNIQYGLKQPHDGIAGRPFSRVIREASLAVLEGFAWHYQKFGPMTGEHGSFTGWQELAPRLQETVYQWDFDEEGHVKGLVQYGSNPMTGEPQYVYYRRDEVVIWSWMDDGGNPEGLGALRRAYRAYKQKDEFQTYAAIRIERQACGVPIAIAPDGVLMTDTQATAVVDLMRAIRTGHDSGGAVPFGWEIKMLELGDASVPFESHIERQHQAILQTTGAQMMGFGQGGDPGSNALIKGAGDWYSDVILECVADWICDTFNCEAVPDFAARNGSTAKKQPELRHGKVAVKNVAEYTRSLAAMFQKSGAEMPADANTTWRQQMGVTPTVDEGVGPVAPVEAVWASVEGGGGGGGGAEGVGGGGAKQKRLPLEESGGGAKKGDGRGGDGKRGKLTEEQVRYIRANQSMGADVLAERFGVDVATIIKARKGITWKSVK
jgi:hypothetical protein